MLDLAAVREGKTITDSYEQSMQTAQHVDQLGFKRYWLAEHHNMESIASAATAVLIGHIAGGTKNIRVGSGGIMLPNHSPLIIAEQFGTLDALYPGRIDLGLGRAPGTDQLTAYALRRDRFAAMDFPEQVRELQTYFSPENKTAKVRAIPGEGADVPVWILGSSTDSAYLAAAMGLPYAFASHFAPTYLMDALRIYRQQFKPSIYLQQPYTMAAVNVIAADSAIDAEYAATSFLQLAASIVRGFPKPLPQPVQNMDELWTPAEEAAVKNMRYYSFTGNQQQVQQQLESFVEATQVNELMIVTNVYDQAVKRRSFEIVAAIKEEMHAKECCAEL